MIRLGIEREPHESLLERTEALGHMGILKFHQRIQTSTYQNKERMKLPPLDSTQ